MYLGSNIQWFFYICRTSGSVVLITHRRCMSIIPTSDEEKVDKFTLLIYGSPFLPPKSVGKWVTSGILLYLHKASRSLLFTT